MNEGEDGLIQAMAMWIEAPPLGDESASDRSLEFPAVAVSESMTVKENILLLLEITCLPYQT